MKKVIIASSIAALGVTGLAGGAVFATANSTSGTDPMSGLVSAIATKFNLKKDDVQKVFDEQRTQMETQREQEVKDHVAQLVKDGKLTQAQADKINAKRPQAYVNNDLFVKASNLCDEITLFADDEHTFSCVLSSMNIARMDEWKDTDAVELAVMFLDAVMSEFIKKVKNIPSMYKTALSLYLHISCTE